MDALASSPLQREASISTAGTAKRRLREYKLKAQAYTGGKGGCEARSERACLPLRLCRLTAASLGWKAPVREGRVLPLLHRCAQQHYRPCAAMMAHVGLAREASWQRAHLQVCLPAYYCKFLKPSAYLGLSSIIDLDLLNPNASSTELTRIASFT